MPNQSERDSLRKTRIEALARDRWIAAGRPSGGPADFVKAAEAEIRQEEAEYDKTVADSFPASDPPAHSGITR
jgi:hypothetical protein